MRRLYSKDNEFKLLLRKEVYPYEYMDSADPMSETCLPPKDEFCSHLTNEHTTNADYRHAQEVWTTFGMRTMKKYYDLYLKCDVVLLADVFDQFRKNANEILQARSTALRFKSRSEL